MNPSQPERVPAFPACRLFALVDSDTDLKGALLALAPYVEPGRVRHLSGERGVRALDVSGRARGFLGCVARAVQDLAFDRGTLELHETHMRRGGHLLMIPARTWEECQRLVTALAPWGAHGLIWFARYSVVDVKPRRYVGRVVTVA
jgi:hypothetical protein